MQIRDVSRWESTPIIDKERQIRFGVKTFCAFFALILCGLGWHAVGFFEGDELASEDIASLSADLRAAVGPMSDFGDPNIGKTVTDLAARVRSLEAENQRLTAEMNQLLDRNGVINTLITHVRALHAQSEATRRDVVGALMAPLPEIGSASPSFERDGAGSTSPLPPGDGTSNPLLTKARHTIVTPVAVPPPAAVAAAEKHKAKAAPAAPEEGNTN